MLWSVGGLPRDHLKQTYITQTVEKASLCVCTTPKTASPRRPPPPPFTSFLAPISAHPVQHEEAWACTGGVYLLPEALTRKPSIRTAPSCVPLIVPMEHFEDPPIQAQSLRILRIPCAITAARNSIQKTYTRTSTIRCTLVWRRRLLWGQRQRAPRDRQAHRPTRKKKKSVRDNNNNNNKTKIITRASAVRPAKARVMWLSIFTILRIVRGSWSLAVARRSTPSTTQSLPLTQTTEDPCRGGVRRRGTAMRERRG